MGVVAFWLTLGHAIRQMMVLAPEALAVAQGQAEEEPAEEAELEAPAVVAQVEPAEEEPAEEPVAVAEAAAPVAEEPRPVTEALVAATQDHG